jgi:hypothetical protein
MLPKSEFLTQILIYSMRRLGYKCWDRTGQTIRREDENLGSRRREISCLSMLRASLRCRNQWHPVHQHRSKLRALISLPKPSVSVSKPTLNVTYWARASAILVCACPMLSLYWMAWCEEELVQRAPRREEEASQRLAPTPTVQAELGSRWLWIKSRCVYSQRLRWRTIQRIVEESE